MDKKGAGIENHFCTWETFFHFFIQQIYIEHLFSA